MHYGQILQSHALHFYHLASPDLLFGFDSDVSRRNIVAVLAAFPDVARQGVMLRKFGQEVIRITAGKRIHGTGAIPGGVNRALTRAERDGLLADITSQVLDLAIRLGCQVGGFIVEPKVVIEAAQNVADTSPGRPADETAASGTENRQGRSQ